MSRVALIGASGRTGRLVIDVLPEFPTLTLAAAVVSPSNSACGSPVPGHAGIRFSHGIAAAVEAADVAIDFSRPEVSVEVAAACAAARKPCLIATTGHSEVQIAVLRAAAARVPLLLAPNTSIGVFVATRMAALAARLLGNSVEVAIHETHHAAKRDAPSGTALAIAAALGEAGTSPTITSARGGDVVGEHTVCFLGRGEQIELTHRATDRRVFARGALRLAEMLIGQPPGFKWMADFFELS